MAGQRQLATTAGRDSIDSRDHRHTTAFDLFAKLLAALGNFARAIFIKSGYFSYIRPGAEGSITHTGKNDGAQMWLAFKVCENLAEGENHLTRKRVQLFRTIQTDDSDLMAALLKDGHCFEFWVSSVEFRIPN